MNSRCIYCSVHFLFAKINPQISQPDLELTTYRLPNLSTYFKYGSRQHILNMCLPY